MTIDMRTGRPVTTTAKTAHRNLKAEDREIRSFINARALGMTTRAYHNVILAAALRPGTSRVHRRAMISF